MSGARPDEAASASHPPAMPRWRRRINQLTRRGLLYSLFLCLLILLLGGVGFWIIEPQAETVSDGLWLAFTTAATVGYGDIVPSTHASRVFAVVVVLLGLAVLSLVTASVAAIFVETEERQIERDLMREIGHLRAQVHALADDLARLRAAAEAARAPADAPKPPTATDPKPQR